MSDDGSEAEAGAYLTGQMLVAMPAMSDSRFTRAVIYVCAHTEEGAMGLIVNQPLESIAFPDLLDQLEIEPAVDVSNIAVLYGGPVETSRGFVLHSPDYHQEGTLPINDHTSLTATVDVLRAIAEGKGPAKRILALGYAGWGPGQLDQELQQSAWLCVPPDEQLLFDDRDLEAKWERALAKVGASVSTLSGAAGHA